MVGGNKNNKLWVSKNILRYQMMCGTIDKTVGKKAGKDTELKFYKVTEVPVTVSYTHLDVYKRQCLLC